MITKLEAGKTYRLIDKQGYFDEHPNNKGFFNKYFSTDATICITEVKRCGAGVIPETVSIIIDPAEYKYFELVEEDKESMKYLLGKPDYSSDWFLPIKDDAEYVIVKTVMEELGVEFCSDAYELEGYEGITSDEGGILRTRCRYDADRPTATLPEALQLLFPQKSKQDLRKEELNASIKQMEDELAKMKQKVGELK